jgi:hypothetical protein
MRVEITERAGTSYSYPIPGPRESARRYAWNAWRNGAASVRVTDRGEVVAEFPANNERRFRCSQNLGQ